MINKSDIYMLTVSELTVWPMPSGTEVCGGSCFGISVGFSNSGGGSVLSRSGLPPLALPIPLPLLRLIGPTKLSVSVS